MEHAPSAPPSPDARHEAAVRQLLAGTKPDPEYPFYPDDHARMQGRGGRGERYREVPFGDEEQLPPVVASHPGARQQVLEDFDYCSRMLDAAGCTERERVCFLGRHWWDQGDGELSKLTGRSEETIRTARASATRKLRALFEQRGG